MKIEVMTGVTIAIMLVLGGGFFWLFMSYVDCSTVVPEKQAFCKLITDSSKYGLVAVAIGFGIMIYILSPAVKGDKERQNESRSPIT